MDWAKNGDGWRQECEELPKECDGQKMDGTWDKNTMIIYCMYT